MRRVRQLRPNPVLAPASISFRRQCRELEDKRDALAARLSVLGKKARTHPAYRCALNLINDRFHKSPVAKRQSVLDAAKWSIALLDRMTAENA
jgi:hypothetical protein